VRGALVPDTLAALDAVPAAIRRERPVVAVDIDETLCETDYTNLLWGIGRDETTPLPGARAALSELSRDYDLLYVTARSKSLAGKTTSWLKRHGFPEGRLITSPTLGDFIFQSGFKRAALRQLRREYPNLVVGIGDKAADAEAYRANRMVPVVVHPWAHHRYHADDVVLRDWSAVAGFFRDNRAVLRDPRRLNDALGRGPVDLLRSGDGRAYGG
jgi:phosphoglycolate phosphatase-like HAD superfamily hydrolase